MDDYLREGSPAPAVLRRYGIVLTAWQKYDDARAAVARADSLDAGDPVSDYVRWAADVLEGKWAEADAIARRESQLADPNWKWLGSAGVATVELYAGQSAAALRSMEASATSAGPSGSNQTGYTRAIAAAQLLALGRPAEALAQAERGLKDAQGWRCRMGVSLFPGARAITNWPDAGGGEDHRHAHGEGQRVAQQRPDARGARAPGRPGAGPPRYGRRRRRASSGRSDAQAAWPLGRRRPAAMDLVRSWLRAARGWPRR